jgi:hypothetical protein
MYCNTVVSSSSTTTALRQQYYHTSYYLRRYYIYQYYIILQCFLYSRYHRCVGCRYYSTQEVQYYSIVVLLCGRTICYIRYPYRTIYGHTAERQRNNPQYTIVEEKYPRTHSYEISTKKSFCIRANIE